MTVKTCNVCKEIKLLSFFHKHEKSPDRLRYECKKCSSDKSLAYYRRRASHCRETQKAWRKGNPILILGYKLKNRYGLTTEDIQKMYDDQNGLCKICNSSGSGDSIKSRLSVDHCHTTGKIRGLLCSRCNSALGLLKESISNLERARIYLEANK